jgi:hypothetical protein
MNKKALIIGVGSAEIKSIFEENLTLIGLPN